jgi:hypothetical protein
MQSKWKSRFQLKPGKWVFVPTDESIRLGHEIKSAIENVWLPPENYFHLRSGGHVGAIRSHMPSKFFLRIDIQNFFASINRTRITRCLNKFFSYQKARDWANASTVIAPTGEKRTILPFGFVQSQLISAVCFSESALGRCLAGIHCDKSLRVSVYVDDIIVSSDKKEACGSALEKIRVAADRSRFKLNEEKLEGPSESITVFNVILSNQRIEIQASRMKDFKKTFASTTNEYEKAGILSYVSSINLDQAAELQ